MKNLLYMIYDAVIPHFTKDVIAVVESEKNPGAYEFAYRAVDVHMVPHYVRQSVAGYVTVSEFRWGPIAFVYNQKATLREHP